MFIAVLFIRVKVIEIESRTVAATHGKKGGCGKLLFNEHRVSVWQNEKLGVEGW